MAEARVMPGKRLIGGINTCQGPTPLVRVLADSMVPCHWYGDPSRAWFDACMTAPRQAAGRERGFIQGSFKRRRDGRREFVCCPSLMADRDRANPNRAAVEGQRQSRGSSRTMTITSFPSTIGREAVRPNPCLAGI